MEMENYTSDSSDSDSEGTRVIDLAYLLLDIDEVKNNLDKYFNEEQSSLGIEKMILHHNQLTRLPDNITNFANIRTLDISNNGLTILPDVFKSMPLTVLIAKNNELNNSSLPKTYSNSPTLKELNLSGNHLVHFPEQILNFTNLKFLYIGGNGMQQLSKNIWKLKK